MPNCIPCGIARVTTQHHEAVKTTTNDDYRIALNGGHRNLELSGALPTEGTNWDVYQRACQTRC
jgi:hypothetical protein